MKTYKEFHGEIEIKEIGKELRKIVRLEKCAFKILTGYGSESGKSKSKVAALKSLKNMKKSGLIQGYIPGEITSQLIIDNSLYKETKEKYFNVLKSDNDFGNDGIIFVFIT